MTKKSNFHLLLACIVLFGLPMLSYFFLKGGLFQYHRIKKEIKLDVPIGDVSSFDFEGTAFAPHKVQGKILSISFLNPKSSNYEQNLATLTKYQTQFKFKEDLILLTYLFDQPDMAMDTMVDRLTAKFPKWKFLKLPVDGQEILRKDFGLADSLLLGNKLEDVVGLIDQHHHLRNVYFLHEMESIKKWVEHTAFLRVPDPSNKRR